MPKYLDMHGLETLTGDIENTYLKKNQRGAAGGVASLNSSGKVPSSQLPDTGTSDYSDLTNKPQINGTTLSGNKTTANLGIHDVPAGGTTGQVLTKHSDTDQDVEWATPPVTDVQTHGTSVVGQGGVANIPPATATDLGVMKVGAGYGLKAADPNGNSAGRIMTDKATSSHIKGFTDEYRPITPAYLPEAVFQGMARAAGDNTQAASQNATGVFTNEAKEAVQSMLKVPDKFVIALDYADLTFPVLKDSLCFNSGVLYKAKQDIQTSETWTAAHWTQTTIEAEQSALKTEINSKADVSDVTELEEKVDQKADEPTGTKSTGKVYGLDSNLNPAWVEKDTDPETIAEATAEWLDDHPEATTTVQDGSISIPKLAQSTKDTVVIQIETEKSAFHDVAPSSVLFYPDARLNNVTCKYTNEQNMLEGLLVTGTQNGVTRTLSGKLLNLSGTGTGQVFIVDTSDESVVSRFKGKTVNFYMFIKKSTPWGSTGVIQFYDGKGTPVYKWYSENTTKYIGWTVFNNISISDTANTISIKLSELSGTTFTDGDCIWIGIYESELVDTENIVTGDNPYEISVSGMNRIDTATHESIVKYVTPTKEYVDNHIPDIKAIWNEEIYALPEKFGAIGDGIEDDTVALNACFSYAAISGKSVRGYGTYKISSSIDIDTRGIDVFLRNIIYTGDQYAIGILSPEISFEFKLIQSNAKGIRFQKGTTRAGSFCKVNGVKIASTGDCISVGGQTLYNTCEIRQLSSSNGNCITFDLLQGESFYGGEYTFRDCSCECPNGWVLYDAHDTKCYNFTLEGNCKNGIYHPNGVSCYAWRHTEFINRYSARISGEHSEYENGPLIKLNGTIMPAMNYNAIIYDSENEIYPYSIDSDEIPKNPVFANNETDLWWLYANNHAVIRCNIITPYEVFRGISTNVIAKEMRFVGSNKVMIPLFHSLQEITTSIYDMRFYDTSDIQTFHDATKVLPATSFAIQTDTTIYLNGSYCAAGINEVTIDTNGNNVVIYDNRNNEVFDSSDYSGTKFKLKCIANHSDKGLKSDGYDAYWCYDGTNHIWEVEEFEGSD